MTKKEDKSGLTNNGEGGGVEKGCEPELEKDRE